MPIYEFKCRDCGNIFEHLQLSSQAQNLTCPRCQSRQIEKQFSNFATPRGGSVCPPSCGTNGGCCGNNGRKCFE